MVSLTQYVWINDYRCGQRGMGGREVDSGTEGIGQCPPHSKPVSVGSAEEDEIRTNSAPGNIALLMRQAGFLLLHNTTTVRTVD